MCIMQSISSVRRVMQSTGAAVTPVTVAIILHRTQALGAGGSRGRWVW